MILWVRNWFDGTICFSKIEITGSGASRSGRVLESHDASHISGDNSSDAAVEWADEMVELLNKEEARRG